MQNEKIRFLILSVFGIGVLTTFLNQRILFNNFEKVKGVELILVTSSKDSVRGVFIQCSNSYFSIDDSIHYSKDEVISIIRFD